LLSLSFDYAIDDNKDEPIEVLQHIKSATKEGIYVLVDFHPFLHEAMNVRLLKDIALQHERYAKTIVLLSHDVVIPDELRNLSTCFNLSLPDREVIQDMVKQEARRWAEENTGRKVKADQQSLDLLVNNLVGLTAAEARRLAHNAIFDDGVINESDLPRVMQSKYALLSQDGVLHFEYDTARFADIGGFRQLKTWLQQRKQAFHQVDFPLDSPKGILLLGVQGCGKSLAAKAVAGVWNIPLLRLDFAAMYNKYQGETERNLRQSLDAAEAMAPCVLWVDEIKKALGTDDQDSGVSRRVLGTLLTWMAEKKAAVFMVATANDIAALPPELVRKGRLDEIFFVDLPDLANRKTIFEIHLRKREYDPLHFNTAELAKQCEGFSGAEIEQCVVSALYSSRASDDKALQDVHLLAEITRTRPLSVVMAEKIHQLRDWAQQRTVSAN